jgi:hypothetical protein
MMLLIMPAAVTGSHATLAARFLDEIPAASAGCESQQAEIRAEAPKAANVELRLSRSTYIAQRRLPCPAMSPFTPF